MLIGARGVFSAGGSGSTPATGRSPRGLATRAAPRWLLAGCVLLGLTPPAATGDEKEILGWVEWVVLTAEGLDGPMRVRAKLDTGAETSSLDATHIRRVRVGERRYVRFEISDPRTGEGISLRRPLLRRVRIKQHDGDSQERPVVSLTVCLAGRSQKIEFSLIDRSEFIYPVLLGRKALEEHVIVDPGLSFLSEPDCGDDEEDEEDEDEDDQDD